MGKFVAYGGNVIWRLGDGVWLNFGEIIGIVLTSFLLIMLE
jgi:hypothetical protein